MVMYIFELCKLPQKELMLRVLALNVMWTMLYIIYESDLFIYLFWTWDICSPIHLLVHGNEE